jgi:hypothetical protein
MIPKDTLNDTLNDTLKDTQGYPKGYPKGYLTRTNSFYFYFIFTEVMNGY